MVNKKLQRLRPCRQKKKNSRSFSLIFFYSLIDLLFGIIFVFNSLQIFKSIHALLKLFSLLQYTIFSFQELSFDLCQGWFDNLSVRKKTTFLNVETLMLSRQEAAIDSYSSETT